MEVFRLISYSVSHICLMCYVLFFTRWKYSPIKTIAIALLATGVLIGLETIRYLTLSQGEVQVWTIILQIVVVQVTAFFLSVYRDFRGLFTGLISSNYVLLGNLISRVVYILGGSFLCSVAVGALIHVLFLGVLIRFLKPSYMEVQYTSRVVWFRLCLIPSSFYLTLLILGNWLRGANLIQNAVILCVLLLVMYLSYVLIFQMVQIIYKDEQVKKERDMLATNIKTMKRIMEEVYLVEQRIAIQNHDRRHLARTIQTLLAEQNYDAIGRLLSKSQDAYTGLERSHYCDNTPVNGVVCYYAEMAQRNQIQMQVTLNIPEEIRVSEWELAIVVGNLMENAIKAAAGVPDVSGRFLWVSAKMLGEQFLIEIQNSFEGSIVFDKKTLLPFSKEGEGHGIGLHSVCCFAQRNQGVFDCGGEDGKFFARLLV